MRSYPSDPNSEVDRDVIEYMLMVSVLAMAVVLVVLATPLEHFLDRWLGF